jgi:hypothetical protein
MIAEKLPIRFNIKRIRNYFNTQVKQKELVSQNEIFGGWSILSASGDYRDGFQLTYGCYNYNQLTGKYDFDYEKAHRENSYTWPKEHINFTQVGTEYIADIINTLRRIGLKPHRARWTRIAAHGSTIWHQDETDDTYAVRLHIPVITNPECAFETNEGKFHMPADGSCYLVKVNCQHRAYNYGDEDRIHIIMDVIDDVGISQYHRTPQSEQLKLSFNTWDMRRILKKIFFLK